MKKVVSLLLAALLAFSVAACGTTSGEATTPAASSAAAGTTAAAADSTAAETSTAAAPAATTQAAAESTATPELKVGVNADEAEVRTLALKGPTSMGLVKFMEKSMDGLVDGHTYSFSIVASVDEVAPRIAKGEVDFAAVPANLASVLYNKTGGGVKVLAINTLGVLYIVENGDSVHSVADLKGRTIFASGKGATPEYALNYILQGNGIDPEKDVTIEWKSEHTECLTAMLAADGGIALLPQPFVTTAQAKADGVRVALDLTAEWNKLQEGKEGASELLTGVVIGRTKFIEEHPDLTDAFLAQYKDSIDFVTANMEGDEPAKLVGFYKIVPEEIAKKALPFCNITFIDGADMKAKLSGYLQVLFDQNPKAVGEKMPGDDFYYVK